MQLEKFTELIYFERKFPLLKKRLNVYVGWTNITETKLYRNEGFPYIAS